MPGRTSKTPRSYFRANADKVQNSTLASSPQAFRDLFIAFLTIKSYRDLLFDPGVHLRKDITQSFIDKVMLPDFGKVILILRDYSGKDRRGIQKSYGLMNQALRELYTARNEKGPVDAALDCRDNLHAAYQQLEYLKKHINNL